MAPKKEMNSRWGAAAQFSYKRPADSFVIQSLFWNIIPFYLCCISIFIRLFVKMFIERPAMYGCYNWNASNCSFNCKWQLGLLFISIKLFCNCQLNKIHAFPYILCCLKTSRIWSVYLFIFNPEHYIAIYTHVFLYIYIYISLYQ